MTTTSNLHRTLSGCLRAPVVAGGTPAASFQTGVEHRPAFTVAPARASEVAAVLDVARRAGLPVTVHATGHGLCVPAGGGVLLDTAGLGGVRVDPVAATARVGAGSTWADVLSAAAPHGLRPPSGSAPSVGVAGYLFGGGIGLTARSDGWAVDHVRAFEVADASGVHEVSGGEVFTRLRGTGPRPGEVVTAVTLGLLPAGPLTGGGLVADLGPADEPGDPGPLRAWARWTSDLPEAVTSGVGVVPYPDLPFLPQALRGRRVLRVGVTVTGTVADADRLLAPLRAALAWDDDTVAPLDPVGSARVYAEPEFPHAYLGDAVLVAGLDPRGLERIATRTGPMVVTGIRHLGGAAGRPARVPDSVRGRDASYVVSALAPFGPDTADAATAWSEVDAVLAGAGTGAGGANRAFRFGPDGSRRRR